MIVYVSWESVNYNGSLIDISLCCVYCLGTSLFLFVGGESCVSIHLYIFIHSIYIIYINIYIVVSGSGSSLYRSLAMFSHSTGCERRNGHDDDDRIDIIDDDHATRIVQSRPTNSHPTQ